LKAVKLFFQIPALLLFVPMALFFIISSCSNCEHHPKDHWDNTEKGRRFLWVCITRRWSWTAQKITPTGGNPCTAGFTSSQVYIRLFFADKLRKLPTLSRLLLPWSWSTD